MSRHLLRPSLRHALRAPASVAGGAADIYTYLVSWWEMEEDLDTDTRVDSRGTSDLAVTAGTCPKVVGKVGDGVEVRNVSNGQLTAANSSALNCGSQLWAIAGWFNAVDTTAARGILYKGSTYAAAEYRMIGTTAASFSIGDGAGVFTTVSVASALQNNVWRFVMAWSDGSNIYIQSSDGAPVSAAIAVTPASGAGDFKIGPYADMGNGAWRYDELAVWVGYNPTVDERTWLFNAGSGRTYAAFAAEYGG